MTKRAQILWLDLEMTGLDAGADLILEVAAIATDWDFNEIGTYEGVIRNDNASLLSRLATNGTFWDRHPTARDGLVGQNEQGKERVEIEDELLEFIGRYFDSEAQVMLGGNSVHIDRRFVVSHWPRLDARLHYRMLDVTAWKVVFEGKYGKRFSKPDAHRALDDIRHSIKELKYYLGKVRV